VIRETYAVERGLDDMGSRVFASERVADLIAEAQTVARAIRSQFLALDGKGETDERRLLRLTRALFALRHHVLPALEQGSLRTRPHEAMLAIESVLAKALPQQVVVLALAGAYHAYAEKDLWSSVRTQLGDLGLEDVLGKANLLFLGVDVPTAEKNNVLLHAILCHEVGHELVASYRWADQFLALLPGDAAVENLADKIEDQEKYRGLTETERQTVLANLVARSGRSYWDSGVLANWLGELLADAVALCVLGPAAAFATAELLSLRLGNDLDPFNQSHPRWALRIELHRLHLEYREEAGNPNFEELLTAYPLAYNYLENVHQTYIGADGVVFDREFEQVEGFSLERTLQFYDALEQALHNKLPEILRTVRKELAPRGLLYTTKDFALEVPALIEKLEALLPPSTVGVFGTETPASYAGIMNAGALVRRDRLTKITTDVGRYQAMELEQAGSGQYDAEDLVFRLVRKAIADADIHRRWLLAATPA
jgi:hypothetical protein